MRIVRIIEPSEQFDEIVATDPAIVYFYHPDCGHCKAMNSDWDALEKRKELIPLEGALMKVHKDAAKKIKSDAGKHMRGFPTIIEVKPGGLKGQEYKGDRSTDDLLRFIMEVLKGQTSGCGAQGGGGRTRRRTGAEPGAEQGAEQDAEYGAEKGVGKAEQGAEQDVEQRLSNTSSCLADLYLRFFLNT